MIDVFFSDRRLVMNITTLTASAAALVLGAVVISQTDLLSGPGFGSSPCDLDFRPGVSALDVMGRASPHNCQTVRVKHHFSDGTTQIEETDARTLPLRMTQRTFPFNPNGVRLDPSDVDQVRTLLLPVR